VDGVRLGSFLVAYCAVACVVLRGVLRETWDIVVWYVYIVLSNFMKTHFSE
jgi:hypothetical protein